MPATSDRRFTQSALRLTEHQSRLAEEIAGIGVFEFDFQTSCWVTTPQIAKLFGLDPNTTSESFSAWEPAVVPEDRPGLHAAIRNARTSGVLNVEFRVAPRAGVRWLVAKGEVAADAGQTRWLRGTCQDITQRKTLEARLLALNESMEDRIRERAHELEASYVRLHESERRFRLLVESVTDYAIYMLDPRGNVVNWNPGAERLKGYSSQEVLGQNFSRFYTPEDRTAGLPQRVLATASTGGKYEGEGWRIRKDGTRFWASVVVHCIHDADGQLLGFAKITRDLTERRNADEQLRQAQKMEAIGQLTGGIAHDFNNLLTVISGNLETLQRRLPEHDENGMRRLVASALHGASRAATLINQLLAFSRRQALEPSAVSISALITHFTELIRRTMPEAITIETILAGGAWQTFVDANQLENCLLNLAVNARDAMPDGGKLTIEVANTWLDDAHAKIADVQPGQYVGLFVSDTGTGMTPEVAAKAFDPFFTTKELGRGTGLGLSQVYGFVRQSGGCLKIDSEVGIGTSVKIYLPRLFASQQLEEHQPTPAAMPLGLGETILMVEDEPNVRSFAVDLMQELGYRTLEAPDGATGLRVLDEHPEIAMLFTDIGLPGGMNGRDFADAARQQRPDLKVLFTSGYARNALVHHGRLDTGVHLITKPFTFAGLAARLRQVLDSA